MELESLATGAQFEAPEPGRSPGHILARLELPDAANEVLAIVRYLTSPDGPLRQPAAGARLSPWHERMLLKAQERLTVLDGFLRGRVAFFVAGRTQGYGSFESEFDVAGAALDTCRATSLVVDALLAGDQPTDRQFDIMAETALKVLPALDEL